MKILQVVPFLSEKKTGSSIVPFCISRYLQKLGHEITILTTDLNLDVGYVRSLKGVRVVPLHYIADIGGMLITPKLDSYSRAVIKNYDIIHMHNFRSYQNIIVYKYAKQKSVPYILQAHGSLPKIFARQRLKELYDLFFGNKILDNANKVVAVSKMEVSQYRHRGVILSKIALIPNGIDAGLFAQLPGQGEFRKKYSIKEKYLVLLLGRIHRSKGIGFLLESFYLLAKETHDVILVIAGPEDGYGREAERLTQKLNLRKRVKFIGGLFGRDKLAAYADADIIANPSAYEIFGLTPLEAMMCERPVVVTSNCGCADFIQKVSGRYVIHYGDTSGFSARMMDLLENPPPAKTMQSIKKRIVDEFSWEKIVRQMEELYYSCVD